MELSQDDADRLVALLGYGILDTEFEDTFDRITRLAARLFEAPISLVSLVDQKRQWFKSAHGLTLRETPREVSFCTHAIQQEDVYVVPDARKSDLFANNPLVTGAPHVAFYAGAPLINSEGYTLGTLCVIDHKPRTGMAEEDKQALMDFANLVVDLMDYRKHYLGIESRLRAVLQ